MRAVKPPLVGQWRVPPELDDGLELWQFVLDEEDALEEGLVVHHDDVRLGVDRDLGDIIGAQLAVHADGDAPEYWREKVYEHI